MKFSQTMLLIVACSWTAAVDAQSPLPPPRLAIVAGSPGTAEVADILTVSLSANPKVQLLERDEIARVYREQGLSAANNDYLKLGQVLGADGLLFIETVREATNEFLNIRLVAVKPGAVLTTERFAWPVKAPTDWATGMSAQLDAFFPKLSVQARDAIPISVVNLRSAIASAGAADIERQLKLLTIQQLSRERQLFILERQKMQLLSGKRSWPRMTPHFGTAVISWKEWWIRTDIHGRQWTLMSD